MAGMQNSSCRWEVVGNIPSGPYPSRSLGNSYTVSGAILPDATGTFYYAGQYDGYDFFRRVDAAYEIWRDTALTQWVLSEKAGDVVAGHWERAEPTIAGIYSPIAPFTGDATVAIAT